MSEKRRLIKNTAVLFLGKMGIQIISFLLLPLYTSYLSTSEYGFVDLVFTYISLFAPVITLQLEMAVFRFLIDAKDKDKRKDMISTVLLLLFTISIGFTIIGFILITALKIKYGFLILLNIMITIYYNMFLQIARGFGKTTNYSIGVFITSALNIVFNVFFLAFLKIGTMGFFLSILIATLISTIYLFLSLQLSEYIDRKRFQKKLVKEFIRYSLPLVPNGLSWWIINVSDRTIISSMLGTSSNGIYAVSNKFPTLFINGTSIFNLAWTESASITIDKKDSDIYFSDIINHTIQIFSSILLFLIAIMPFAFPILIHEKFKEAYQYIPILLISALVNSVIKLYSGIYVAKKLTKKVMNTSLVAAMINLLMNLILIKKIGIYAACLSTLIAYLSMMIYRYIDLKKYIHITYDKKNILTIIILLSITMISYSINHFVLNIIILIVILIYIFYFNRKYFIWIFKHKNLTKQEKAL